MKQVNVIFDDDLSDVDIILVPDDIADNIEYVVQCFFNWIFEQNNKHLFEKSIGDGKMVVSVGTHEFIWWLNNYRITVDAKATVVREHTVYCAEYPSVEF